MSDDLIAAMEIIAEKTDDIDAAGLLYDAIAALRASAERERELREVLTECMNQHRALRSEAMRLEGRQISNEFVLAQTDIAVRRARAILDKHKEQT